MAAASRTASAYEAGAGTDMLLEGGRRERTEGNRKKRKEG